MPACLHARAEENAGRIQLFGQPAVFITAEI